LCYNEFVVKESDLMEERNFKMPLIGDPAPHFEAVTTQGKITSPKIIKEMGDPVLSSG
jgi:hypothetical protein